MSIDEWVLGFDVRDSVASVLVDSKSYSPRVDQSCWPNRMDYAANFQAFLTDVEKLADLYFRKAAERAVDAVAVTALNFPFYAIEHLYEVDGSDVDELSEAQAADIIRCNKSLGMMRPSADWEFLGYDVANVWLNVDHWPHMFAEGQWAPHWKNRYLLESLEDVESIIEYCDQHFDHESPFCGYGLYRIDASILTTYVEKPSGA